MTLDPVELLRGLLTHYSPTGREAGAAVYLVEGMQRLGFDARVDPAGNAVGTRGQGPREIVLLGHIDTVPGRIRVAQRGGALYGRGAVDAKGPLACFTAAAARARLPEGCRVTVVGAVGEEGDSRGAIYLRDTHPAPQAVVIGEPSGWEQITLGYKGSQWLRYTARRPLAHTAAQRPSACEQAVEFWLAVQRLAERASAGRERAFERLSASLRGMHSASDGFAETARLEINLRLPPGLDPAALRGDLAALAADGALEFDAGIPAWRCEKNTALVRAFLASIRARGGKPGFLLKSGTADMNIVGPAWNCPMLAYGPGDSALDHTAEEHILIEEYLKGVDVLAGALENAL